MAMHNDGPATVVRGEAAALLVDAQRNRFFKVFLARERGVSEAAAQLGVGKSLVSYWVGRLRRLGLLHETSGPGRLRRYRSVGDRYVASLADVPLDSLDDILDAHMDPGFARLKQALLRVALRYRQHWCFRVGRVPQGVYESLEPEQGTLAQAGIVNQHGTLHLSPDEAQCLRDALQATWDRYAQLSRPGSGRKPWLLWVAAVEDQAAVPAARQARCASDLD